MVKGILKAFCFFWAKCWFITQSLLSTPVINFSFWIPFPQRFPGLTPPLVCFPRCAYLRFLTLCTAILFSKSQVAWEARLLLSPAPKAMQHHINNRLSVNGGLIFDLSLPCCDMLVKYTTCFSVVALMFSSVKWKGKTRSLYCSMGLSLDTEEVMTKQREHQDGSLNHNTWMYYV